MQILKQTRKEMSKCDSYNLNNDKNRDQSITSMVCSGDRSVTEQECRIVLDMIGQFNVKPFEVGQRVLAKMGTLYTGTILASDISSAYIQFDKVDLGVYQVQDIDMITFEGDGSVPLEGGKSQVVSSNDMLNDIRDINLNPHIKSLLGDEPSEILNANQISIDETQVSQIIIIIRHYSSTSLTLKQWGCYRYYSKESL